MRHRTPTPAAIEPGVAIQLSAIAELVASLDRGQDDLRRSQTALVARVCDLEDAPPRTDPGEADDLRVVMAMIHAMAGDNLAPRTLDRLGDALEADYEVREDLGAANMVIGVVGDMCSAHLARQANGPNADPGPRLSAQHDGPTPEPLAQAEAFRDKVAAHRSEAQRMGEELVRSMDPAAAAETLGLIAEVGRIHEATAVVIARAKAHFDELERRLPAVDEHLADARFDGWSAAAGASLVYDLLASIAALGESAVGMGEFIDPVTAAGRLSEFRGSGALVEAARRGVAP